MAVKFLACTTEWVMAPFPKMRKVWGMQIRVGIATRILF